MERFPHVREAWYSRKESTRYTNQMSRMALAARHGDLQLAKPMNEFKRRLFAAVLPADAYNPETPDTLLRPTTRTERKAARKMLQGLCSAWEYHDTSHAFMPLVEDILSTQLSRVRQAIKKHQAAEALKRSVYRLLRTFSSGLKVRYRAPDPVFRGKHRDYEYDVYQLQLDKRAVKVSFLHVHPLDQREKRDPIVYTLPYETLYSGKAANEVRLVLSNDEQAPRGSARDNQARQWADRWLDLTNMERWLIRRALFPSAADEGLYDDAMGLNDHNHAVNTSIDFDEEEVQIVQRPKRALEDDEQTPPLLAKRPRKNEPDSGPVSIASSDDDDIPLTPRVDLDLDSLELVPPSSAEVDDANLAIITPRAASELEVPRTPGADLLASLEQDDALLLRELQITLAMPRQMAEPILIVIDD